MTPEQKELLMKDLCSRLPYGVKVKFKTNGVIENKENFIYNEDGEYEYITNGKSYLTLDIIKMLSNNYIDEIKSYLFPMSSMTEEQKLEFIDTCTFFRDSTFGWTDRTFDWLNKNHFDFRDLIPMGLAIDCTNLNVY